MVDWKKDIKLSDLLARSKDDAVEGDETELPLQRAEADHEQSFSDEPEEVDGSDDAEATDAPFWKREIAFGRGKDATEDPEFEPSEDEPERHSFFTRSLGFGRAKDQEMADTDVDHSAAEPEEATPFWKRELSFGRRSDDAPSERFEESEPEPIAEAALEEDVIEKAPFWKRELSFGRRKDEATSEAVEESAPEAAVEDEPEAVEKAPFWKRELSFGRRGDDATPETFEPAHSEEAADEPFESDQPGKTPFWKRELGFGRRADEFTSETSVEREEESEPSFAADEPEKTPFWKRELRFGRGGDDAPPEEGEPEQTTEDTFESEQPEKTPFWKRELRFGRRKDDTTTEAFDEFEPEPTVEDGFEADVAAKRPFWKRELSFGRRKEDEAAETPVEYEEPAFAEPEQVAPAVAEPEPVAKMHWTEEPGDEHEPEEPTSAESEGPASVEPEPVADAAVPEPEEVDETPFADEVSADRDAVETAPQGWAEHDEPTPVEPVAASFLEPEPVEETDGAPFWKREIKFGRRRGDAGLAPAVGMPTPPGDEADTLMEAGPEGSRFWKRDLSFGRGKDLDLDAPKPDKRPFWKRDLSFGRQKDAGGQQLPGRGARRSRTKQVVGLKVGASQIAAARVVNNGSPELVQLARQSIEQGIVVGGELRDPDALAEALREFFAVHRLPNKNVRLGIGNNRIGVRSFEISGVHDPKQLENAVRFRAQEALPIPLDEAVLDYQVIDEAASPTGIRTYRVLLVVAYRELVDRYIAACRGAGLRLVGIDLEAFALLRALSPPAAEGLPEDTALVAVSIGHDRSTFAVSNGKVCEFTRVLDWGGSSLNTAIARALDITPSQAEPVKRTLSLSEGENGAPSGQSNEHTLRAEEAVRLELQTFARELVSSLHFYQNQPGSLAIGSITLTGGTAHLPGLASELQRLIGVKVRVGDPLRRVKTAKRVETPAQVGSMAVAIGLGIED
jgi:type IV pilus assembly protein PilM